MDVLAACVGAVGLLVLALMATAPALADLPLPLPASLSRRPARADAARPPTGPGRSPGGVAGPGGSAF